MLGGGVLDELSKEKSVPEINSEEGLRKILSSYVLFDIMRRSKISEILGNDVNYVHIDKGIEESRVDRKRSSRSSSSRNPCYIEVYYQILYYQASTFYGSRMFTYLVFKDFRSGKLVKSSGYGKGQLPKFTKQSLEVATTMLRDSVGEVVNELSEKKLSKGEIR